MTKYVLKRDTPFYKKGTEFSEDLMNKGVLLNDDCYAVADLNELDNPDEWFEEIKGDYLFEEITHYDQGDKVAVNIWFSNDEHGRHSKKMVDFVQFIKAVNAVSQDKGFMTRGVSGLGWVICLKDDGQLCTTLVGDELAGAFCFGCGKDADESLDKHRDEWKTILNYDWSKE